LAERVTKKYGQVSRRQGNGRRVSQSDLDWRSLGVLVRDHPRIALRNGGQGGRQLDAQNAGERSLAGDNERTPLAATEIDKSQSLRPWQHRQGLP
jgi:hypothetical protein